MSIPGQATRGCVSRFTVEVSEFTVMSHLSDGDNSRPRVDFSLEGRVRVDGLDAELALSAGPHPLVGRPLSVSFSGGRKCAPDGCLGYIQFIPDAPEIAATARVVCCPRRVASLRATAHHASGPLGGRLRLVLEVAPAENGGGPVVRIPIRDAMIQATRRFDAAFAEPVPLTSPSPEGVVGICETEGGFHGDIAPFDAP